MSDDGAKKEYVAWLQGIFATASESCRAMKRWVSAHRSGTGTTNLEKRVRQCAGELATVATPKEELWHIAIFREVDGPIGSIRKAACDVRDFPTVDEWQAAQDRLVAALRWLRDEVPTPVENTAHGDGQSEDDTARSSERSVARPSGEG
jgi:hypothetical protein